MKYEIWRDDGHLRPVAFLALDGTPSEETRISICEHLSSCEHCSEAYADFICGGDSAEEVPDGLESRIIERIKRKKTSARLEFWGRLVKVSVAAVFAIGLYAGGVFDINLKELEDGFIAEAGRDLGSVYRETVQKFSDSFGGLSGPIFEKYGKDDTLE